MNPDILKYPRTQHIQGSRLQPGDEDLEQVAFEAIRGRHIVVEEKVDGANAGLRFADDGRLLLQSRGHFLTGGPRERHFALYKTWASAHQHALREALGSRYVMYGEWLYARHTVFYDRLPHYLMEFDVLDTERGVFLSTPARAMLFRGLPIVPVRVLYEGPAISIEHLRALVAPSAFKSDGWRDRLDEVARREGLDGAKVRAETDLSDAMEGLYLKVEEKGAVVGRYKFIRPSFVTAVLDSGSHWLDRPIVPNQLADGVDLFAPSLA
ncbi:MAG: RNA ligase family protein [Polyangiales bacterium]